MGAYAQCAERLIERGFAAVPIVPGTKRPGFFFAGMWIGLANWQRRFNGGPPPATSASAGPRATPVSASLPVRPVTA